MFHSLTDYLAVYGAGVATLSLIVAVVALAWNIKNHYRDRGKLKVEAKVGKILPPHMDADKPVLFIFLTNVGRRPILVQTIGFELQKSGDGASFLMIIPRFLPRKLEESDSVTEWTDSTVLLTKNLRTIIASDSTGKEWRLPQYKLKSLIRQAEALRTNGQEGGSANTIR